MGGLHKHVLGPGDLVKVELGAAAVQMWALAPQVPRAPFPPQ